MSGVPASNLQGTSLNVGAAQVDLADHLATAHERRHLLEQLAPRPERARAGRPERLVAGEDEEVGVRASWTSTGPCGTACAPSTSTSAPAAWALATISLTGLIVPMPFDTAVKATSLGLVRSRTSKLSWLSRPVVVEWARTRGRRPSPGPAAATGTRLEWCSSSVRTIVSAWPMLRAAPRVGDEVDGLGRVADHDDLARVAGR